jgi:hypothetical protein
LIEIDALGDMMYILCGTNWAWFYNIKNRSRFGWNSTKYE